MTVAITQINTSSDTFQTWVTKTNDIINALGNNAVTADATSGGSNTTGNVAIIGIITANTIAAGSALRGGTVGTSANLTISSNLHVTGANLSSSATALNLALGAYANIATDIITFSSNTFTVTGNTNLRNNTLSISTGGRVGVNTGSATAALDVVGTATFGGGTMTINGNTTFYANVTASSNATFNGAVTTIGGILSATGNAAFSANVTITNALSANTLTVNNNVIMTGNVSTNTLSTNTITLSTPLTIAGGGTGASNTVNARSNLGLGSLATLNTITSTQFTSSVSLVIYDSAGFALKTLYGSSS